MSMKTVFMGTPEFGAVCLRKLLDEGYEVCAVVTQPDRPKGRGNKLVFSPVKEIAVNAGIPVLQPEKISRECVEELEKMHPDVFVTAAFGQFLSEKILSIPVYGTVNVHASLLPKHRGSAPINWSVILGEKETGITTMMTVRKMDAGDILLQKKVPILEDETAGELTERLAGIGAELLIETLQKLEKGNCPRTPQNEEEMTYEPMLTKENGRINWQESAERICCLVRGTSPWPGAYCDMAGEVMKVWKAVPAENGYAGEPGNVITADPKNGLIVACGSGAVKITEIQMQGGKRMSVSAYLSGHRITVSSLG